MTPLVVLALLLGAGEPVEEVATVLARRVSVSAAESSILVERVTQQLDVPGALSVAETQKRLARVAMKDGTPCNGKAECHQELGRQLKVAWLVLVSVSQIAQDQSLALELFDVEGGVVREHESVLLEVRGEIPRSSTEGFRRRLVQVIQPAQPEVVLVPEVKVEPVVVPVAAPEPKVSHLKSLVAGGIGIAALGTGVGLLISGLSLRGQLGEGPMRSGMVLSPLTGAQAEAIQRASVVQVSLSAVLGLVGLGLGGLALWWW